MTVPPLRPELSVSPTPKQLNNIIWCSSHDYLLQLLLSHTSGKIFREQDFLGQTRFKDPTTVRKSGFSGKWENSFIYI